MPPTVIESSAAAGLGFSFGFDPGLGCAQNLALALSFRFIHLKYKKLGLMIKSVMSSILRTNYQLDPYFHLY